MGSTPSWNRAPREAPSAPSLASQGRGARGRQCRRLCHTGDNLSGHSRDQRQPRTALCWTGRVPCPHSPGRASQWPAADDASGLPSSLHAQRARPGLPGGRPGTCGAKICFDEEAEPHDVPDHGVSRASGLPSVPKGDSAPGTCHLALV